MDGARHPMKCSTARSHRIQLLLLHIASETQGLPGPAAMQETAIEQQSSKSADSGAARHGIRHTRRPPASGCDARLYRGPSTPEGSIPGTATGCLRLLEGVLACRPPPGGWGNQQRGDRQTSAGLSWQGSPLGFAPGLPSRSWAAPQPAKIAASSPIKPGSCSGSRAAKALQQNSLLNAVSIRSRGPFCAFFS